MVRTEPDPLSAALFGGGASDQPEDIVSPFHYFSSPRPHPFRGGPGHGAARSDKVKENRTWEAILMLDHCIHLDPMYSPAYLLLARLYSGRGLHTEVGRLLRQVIKLEPHTNDYLAEYAAWLRDRGRSWEALRYFLKSLTVSVIHGESLLGASRTLRDMGQYPRIYQLRIRAHITRNQQSRRFYSGDIYVRGWILHTEPQYSEERSTKISLGGEGHPNESGAHKKTLCPAREIPSIASHLEQDSNRSQQTRCRSRGSRRRGGTPRRQESAGEAGRNMPPPLLVQNLLDTLK
uniref:(California timema) hypothetical protein n=1 Tax=Timema californicum TaxID=61474 RepID=A0A7R9J6Z9_TIMCA|nr:unnamed protein product [Timema californicum]